MTWLGLLFGCQTIELKDSGEELLAASEADITLDISVVMEHLTALDQIGQDNSNNRALGTPGGSASQEYVRSTLEAAGYNVWVEDFPVQWFEEFSPSVLTLGGAELNTIALTYSAAGDVTGVLQAVDIQIPPGSAANSSSSGCESSDFASFQAGNIALIQRGSCNFITKAENAQEAGAIGVIIFNEGQSGRRDIVEGTLGEPGILIPVIGVSFSTGEILAQASDVVQITVDAGIQEVTIQNILAEREVGDANAIVLIGGHLDSVTAGPGINDNGSGSATLLAMAQRFAEIDYQAVNRVRFAFWGAEEVGLVGSTYHVENAAEAELSKILGNLNFDMLASPNYARFIYDGDGDAYGFAGPEGSNQLEAWFQEGFEAQELEYLDTAFDGRSDYGPFIAAGIPAGGLFSGAEGLKSESEVAGQGGEAGRAYDPCYHQACDTLENINQEGLEQLIGSIMYTTDKFAQAADFSSRRRVNKDLYQQRKKSFLYWGERLQR